MPVVLPLRDGGRHPVPQPAPDPAVGAPGPSRGPRAIGLPPAPENFLWTILVGNTLANFGAVVLVFLAFMTALIGGVDLGLAKLVLLVFG